ncbi:division plane positioning ATPase MipZ [Buttiauxella sp. S19-1]|uniref:division plane positioning ATPase MipZ n=1 Tax=Buttiauxella sp. S19-1 TaxID=941430 RepID=UPI001EDAFB9A|nr:division plane positioning ATPase MipZ [Buttiauxella sp. S19-1]
MIIVVGSTQGGVSKSTNATNLAAALANKSDDVCMVAGDKNFRTTPRWAEDRAETDLPKITFIEQLGDLNKLLLELDKKFKYVIVDPAGKDSREFRTALAVSHVSIVPVAPTQADVDNMKDLTMVLATAQQLNPSLQVYVLLTRASTNLKSHDVTSARALLADYDEFTVLNAVMYERNIYREALGSGRGVMEVHRSPSKIRDKQLATAEIESILQEIMSLCSPQPSETTAVIKEFTSSADTPKTQQLVQMPAPDAPRNRRTQYLFNDYEHDLIYRAAKATDRSMQAFMRRAVLQGARKVLGED